MTDSDSPPGVPRWVIVLGIAAVVAALVLGILHLTGNSFGSDLHRPPGEHSTHQP